MKWRLLSRKQKKQKEEEEQEEEGLIPQVSPGTGLQL